MNVVVVKQRERERTSFTQQAPLTPFKRELSNPKKPITMNEVSYINVEKLRERESVCVSSLTTSFSKILKRVFLCFFFWFLYKLCVSIYLLLPL